MNNNKDDKKKDDGHKDNLSLWSAVEKTDPAMTRKVSQRGGFTSIDAYSQIRVATEQFGPYGKDWGLRDVELDMTSLASDGVAIYKAMFFYPGGSFPVINTITFRKRNGVDDEFAKKVETDTLTKALSRLGFNADVFMGRFDDSRYVEQRAREVADEDLAQNPELKEKIEKAIELIDGIDSKEALARLPETLKKQFPEAVCKYPGVRNAYSQKRKSLSQNRGVAA